MKNFSYYYFNKKKKVWDKCFNSDDENSIINQIQKMLWDTAVFNVIKEARQIGVSTEKSSSELDVIVDKFIHKCFFENQLMAIRRIIYGKEIKGKRGEYSFISLLDDMKKNAHLFTRRNIFLADGLEYDYEQVKYKYHQYINKKITHNNGKWAGPVPTDLIYEYSEELHNYIDGLCGVNERKRLPKDTVREEVFSFLKKKLEANSDDIKKLADKVVAHAAAPESREDVSADRIAISFKKLREAQEDICKAFNTIYLYILAFSTHNLRPSIQYDIFTQYDNKKILEKVWDDYWEEVEKWKHWDIEEIKQDINEKESKQTKEAKLRLLQQRKRKLITLPLISVRRRGGRGRTYRLC